jgi:hypothetical protein
MSHERGVRKKKTAALANNEKFYPSFTTLI